MEPDPWDAFEIETPALVSAKVKSIKKFGIFLEVEPGIVGLLHHTEIQVPLESFSKDEYVTVYITGYDKRKKHLFLSSTN